MHRGKHCAYSGSEWLKSIWERLVLGRRWLKSPLPILEVGDVLIARAWLLFVLGRRWLKSPLPASPLAWEKANRAHGGDLGDQRLCWGRGVQMEKTQGAGLRPCSPAAYFSRCWCTLWESFLPASNNHPHSEQDKSLRNYAKVPICPRWHVGKAALLLI